MTNPNREAQIEAGEITSSYGDSWILAVDEQQALDYGREQYGEVELHEIGWMVSTGWDRENFKRKRDFEYETGMTSWWESCQPPSDGIATKKCMRVFEWTEVLTATTTNEGDNHDQPQ